MTSISRQFVPISQQLDHPTAQGFSQLNKSLAQMIAEINAGTDLQQLQHRTFASLPSSPTRGAMVHISDSSTATWGATIAGGGTNSVLAFYNGSVWTVAGK